MFSPEDELRPFKRSRANVQGEDDSEAAFFNGIDFVDTLEGLSDGLVSVLEDNDFADCVLPTLFDGSPDGISKLNITPTEAQIHGALRPRSSLRSSPPLGGSISPPVPSPRTSAGGTSRRITAPPTAPGRLHRPVAASGHRHATQTSGAFIPTPVSATTAVPVPRTTGSACLVQRPGSGSRPSRPSPGYRNGNGSPIVSSRAGAGPGAARSGFGSGSGHRSGGRSGSEVPGSAGAGTLHPLGGGSHGAAAREKNAVAEPTTTAARGGGRNGTVPAATAAGGFGGWSHSGLDGEEENEEGAADRQILGSPVQRVASATTTVAAAAATTCAGSSAAADGSLLLRVFNGAMRPEVAALAAAAAQRALVTSPAVPPGLYFSEPERGDPIRTAAAPAAASARGSKRGGKDRQGFTAGPTLPTLTALPFAKYYPEAEAELIAALYSKRSLPRRVRVEPITDRCHPCFRNPFEGLASVKERRKLVATGPLPEGSLLGTYTGELRSGKMDERIVGGDLSGAEGLKAAFTLTLLDDLETRASEHDVVAQNAPPIRDSLVIVGDPVTCPLAEANAPRFWGSCASLLRGRNGEGERSTCNCRAYTCRTNNAAVIPCVLKVRLSRLKARVEAAGGGACATEGLIKGLEVLRAASAAAAAATGGTLSGAQAPTVGLTAATTAAGAAPAASGPGGGRAGGTPGATAANVSDDADKSTFVYGIVTVVVTSSIVKEGEEILLRWDSDDSFFAVADQNLRQYLYIRGLAAERDSAEAKVSEHRRQLTLLRKAHRECQAAREAAIQQRDEAINQKEEVERSLEKALRQREVAMRQKDEAFEDLNGQRVASAAVAAAAGPRVTRLEVRVAELLAERDTLMAQLEQLQRHRPLLLQQRCSHQHPQEQQHPHQYQQQQHPHQYQQQQQQKSEQEVPHQCLHQADDRFDQRQIGKKDRDSKPLMQQQQQQYLAGPGKAAAAQTVLLQGAGGDTAADMRPQPQLSPAVPQPPQPGLMPADICHPTKRQRNDGGTDMQTRVPEVDTTETAIGATVSSSLAAGGVIGNGVTSNPGNNPYADDDGYWKLGDSGWSEAIELLQRYTDAKRHHDDAAAELVAALGQQEAAQERRAARLEFQLADAGRQLAVAKREAEEAKGRLDELQRELDASRVRAAQLQKRLLNGVPAGGLPDGPDGGDGGGGDVCR
ncbi:hypothetical protein Vafri_18439 [Volvox africanus]|uniref:SET domain-containing protein n=1 Tax=Volvox africanus TaxID=51714 RepID=A0A8J4BNB7_9CHLO|nr:hypothetical protein Vafri_18439 [Volvox africanus]